MERLRRLRAEAGGEDRPLTITVMASLSRRAEITAWQRAGVDRIIVGTYQGNYKARGVLEKLGYRECTNSDEVLRAYYSIPEERLRTSVAYEKLR